MLGYITLSFIINHNIYIYQIAASFLASIFHKVV